MTKKMILLSSFAYLSVVAQPPLESEPISTYLEIAPSNHIIEQKLETIIEKNPHDFTNLKMDEFKFIYDLELKNKIGEIITKKTNFIVNNGPTSTILHWLTSLLIKSSNSFESINKWKNLLKNKQITDYDDNINNVIKTDYKNIEEFFIQTQKLKENNTDSISDLLKKIYKGYGHRWNDAYEVKQQSHPSRSLNALKEKGLKISLDLPSLDTLKKNKNKDCPYIENLKNDRILTINGFKNSKISLAVHDSFDHFWTFYALEATGILDRYKDFLSRVGNPHTTDIFKREGELIASVSYEYRFTYFSKQKYHSLFNFEEIKNFIINPQTENQKKALLLLELNNDDSKYYENLCRVFSGVYIELMEQRRKHGFIRQCDNIHQSLPTFDPEYVSLIIEIYSLLYSNNKIVESNVLNILLILENYFHQNISNEKITDLTIHIADIENYDSENIWLSKDKVKWIKDNIGSISNRKISC